MKTGSKLKPALALWIALSVAWAPVPVQAATVEDLEKKIAQMEKAHQTEMAELKRQIEELRKGQAALAQAPSEEPPTGAFPGKLEGKRADLPPAFGGIYDKPFLRRFGRNTYLGGYVDLEYKDTEDTGRTFDQHRLIPFIYSDITDNLKFAAEIEFERGGPDNNQSDGEVKVEFATIDYLLAEWANFRGGIVLSPLGKLNLVHDSPLQDLTDRPLVDTNIFPTTLSEAGAGFYGSFYPTATGKIDYELYAVNGFDGGGDIASAIASKINVNKGIRDARGSQKSDNNDNLSYVGRLAFSPWLGAEIGTSLHRGAYSDNGDLHLTVYGVDGMLQKGPWELLGEYGVAEIDRSVEIHRANSALSKTSTSLIPGRLEGYYVQGNYHFMPPAFKRWWPKIFTSDSTFTAVTRWEQVDLSADEVSDVGNRDRLTLGINFRPVEDAVFKFDYQMNSGDQAADDRDAFIASVATYF